MSTLNIVVAGLSSALIVVICIRLRQWSLPNMPWTGDDWLGISFVAACALMMTFAVAGVWH